MYTDLKSYQLIISLLKQYGITHCVLSAGSRNVPFVHSIEEDPEFHCYSVVDERSAGYFALGLAQELNEPVVISCTSSTATCNYWPPVAEAFYQGVPIVVLTSDRDPAMLGQWEDQMIDQVGMYDRHVRKSVNLPIINSRDDEIYCQRLINEALLELNHHGTGPVHINIPSKTYNNSFPLKELPKAQKINRIGMEDSKTVWEEKIEKLKSAKRILVTCGQNSCVSKKLNNEGGSEFYFNKIWRNEASDLHTTARHKTKAELWVKSNDFIYLKATDKDSLEESLKIFMNEDNEKPVFLEVFTEMKHDSQVIYDFFDLSRPKDAQSEVLRKSKDFLKSTIGQEKANKIKAILKKN